MLHRSASTCISPSRRAFVQQATSELRVQADRDGQSPKANGASGLQVDERVVVREDDKVEYSSHLDRVRGRSEGCNPNNIIPEVPLSFSLPDFRNNTIIILILGLVGYYSSRVTQHSGHRIRKTIPPISPSPSAH